MERDRELEEAKSWCLDQINALIESETRDIKGWLSWSYPGRLTSGLIACLFPLFI